ncbi:MAG: hypothetical protein J7J86_04160 [Bacteroidales bacterium]|nr:hypothetical protein [Bacteroidales bacterium]
MSVEIRQVKTKKDLKEFIYLSEKIFSSNPKWIPPIYTNFKNSLNPKKNKSLSFCDTILILAYKNNDIYGRVMGIINHNYNKYHNVKTCRFAYYESYNDQETANALLEYIAKWGKEKGMDTIVGPMIFSNKDPQGFLVEGFDTEPSIFSNHTPEFYIKLIENASFQKDVDYISFKLPVPKVLPEFFQKIYNRIVTRSNYKVLEFNKTKDIKKYLKPIITLMNDSYKELYSYEPQDVEGTLKLFKSYLKIINPHFVKIITKNDKIVSFFIGVPNFTKGLKKAKGKLFPFGFLKIKREMKKSKQLVLLLGSIDRKHQGRGLDVLMGYHMILSAQKYNFDYIDSHLELETNKKVHAEMQKMGGEVFKRFRIFKKSIK